MAAVVIPTVSEAAGPWKGQVVDKEAGKPLEGVVVLAYWYKNTGGSYYDSEEAVTSVDGRFTIGSKHTWLLNLFNLIRGPEFYIFKSGYGQWKFQGQDEWSADGLKREEQRKQTWKKFEGDGVVLEVPSLKTFQERREFLPYASPPGVVPDSAMKRYIEAIDVERVSLGFSPTGRSKVKGNK